MNDAHPFELAGMGRGPYRFIGMWSFPSRDLAEKNPTAYNLALSEMPKLKGGCGTCQNCGMAISNVCIVADADGNRYGVGSDCVEKTGDKAIGDKARIAVAQHRRRLAAIARENKRQAQHQAWLAMVCNDAGETNAQRLARENAERAQRESAVAARLARVGAILKPLADAVRDGKGGFCDSIAQSMESGKIPYGRGHELVREIYGRRAGRAGSKANTEAQEQAMEILCTAQAEEDHATVTRS